MQFSKCCNTKIWRLGPSPSMTPNAIQTKTTDSQELVGRKIFEAVLTDAVPNIFLMTLNKILNC